MSTTDEKGVFLFLFNYKSDPQDAFDTEGLFQAKKSKAKSG